MTKGSESVGVTGDLAIPESGIRHRVQNQVDVRSEGLAMHSITVEKVKEAADALLAKTAAV